jgi:hypothetical protein
VQHAHVVVRLALARFGLIAALAQPAVRVGAGDVEQAVAGAGVVRHRADQGFGDEAEQRRGDLGSRRLGVTADRQGRFQRERHPRQGR